MKTARLAIISTHPIQYYAPLFQALARSVSIRPRVFYTWSQTADAAVPDAGFGRTVSWDIPLLEGYEFEFVPNVARRPGTDHFRGLRNPGLIRAVEAWQPDAVLVFAWNSESHLRALVHFKSRIPVFFRGDSTLLDPRRGWRKLARRLFLSWVYRHIDVAIAVGANNSDYYRWCGVPAERIAFAPHAIDAKRFSDPDGSHERRAVQWREQLGIAAEDRVALFAGKMQPKKDPFLLLEAFLGCGVPGHLIFAGNGVLEAPLRARARGRANVHFLPFQNQQAMPALYRLGDVFVLPSRGPGETWGLAINEAMASARAVIASDKAGAVRDLLRNERVGWSFEAGNREQLTAILGNALRCNAQTIRAMGKAAQLESAHWSIEVAAAGIENAIVRYTSRQSQLSRA